jgi:radical SAM superfamily enzyme YgiQ (UPF0313 family)
LLSVGINIKGYLIFGFPNESKDDMSRTYNFACELKEISNKMDGNFRIDLHANNGTNK